eukprot:gb/GFBE01010342.1/.p1 GENE.gb/GFBE01010342.1/~~gb/GFBE01010342.1/.p1  ORF type:complete len:222 (+),score=33.50 gb/GFBE01010342.1/:1-666(+)
MPPELDVDWDSLVFVLDDADARATSWSSGSTALPSQLEQKGNSSASNAPPLAALTGETEQERLIGQAVRRCQELRERLSTMERMQRMERKGVVAKVARPLQRSASGTDVAKRIGGEHRPEALGNAWMPHCRFGSRCMYLAGRSCQYYHPPEHHLTDGAVSDVPSHRSASLAGRRWNVLVNESNSRGITQVTSAAAMDSDTEVPRSRSPRHAQPEVICLDLD